MPRKACFSRLWSTIVLLALSLLLGVAHAAQRELKEVRVAYPPSMASVTLMTGIKQKFFEEQGLTLTLLVIASDLALKSQVVGEIDYTLFGGGTGMVAAAQGLPIRIVHLPHKFADLTLVARNGNRIMETSIKNPAVGAAMARAYHNWCHDYANADPARLKFTATLPAGDSRNIKQSLSCAAKKLLSAVFPVRFTVPRALCLVLADWTPTKMS
jgi:ABC-type nitrate/sulfonate/bicarbonate transport system substrate-binding protein